MAGAPLLSPAIVVGSVRYGETSRIVRLITRDFGVVSAIAKGALRPRSRFGAALQLLSEGQAHLIASRSGDLHTLAAFDLADPHAGLASHLLRFSSASALAELVGRFVPAVASAALFDGVRRDVALLELAPVDALPVVSVRALWHLIDQLGHAPVVNQCARDGAALSDGDVAFSLRDGGFLCSTCGRQGASTHLGPQDRADLVALLGGGGNLPLLTAAQAAAHRRLFHRWVREHLADGKLPALESWVEGLPGSP